MASTALKKINARVKFLAKKHPGKKRVTLQRQAGKEYREGKLGGHKKKVVHKKKAVHKKRRVGSTARKTTNVGADKVDRKRVSVNIGGITKAQAKSVIRDTTREQLAWALLQRDTAKTKTARRKISKKVISLRTELRNFS